MVGLLEYPLQPARTVYGLFRTGLRIDLDLITDHGNETDMKLSKTIIDALKQIAGADAVLTETADLAAYSYDGTSNWQSTPQAVVFPESIGLLIGFQKKRFEHLR